MTFTRNIGICLVLLSGCGEIGSPFYPPGNECGCSARAVFQTGTYEYEDGHYWDPGTTVVPFPHAATGVTDLKMTIDREKSEIVISYKRGATAVVERWEGL